MRGSTASAQFNGVRDHFQGQIGTPMRIAPCRLAGETVCLEPLTQEHARELARAALDESVGRWMPFPMRTPEALVQYIADALDEQAAGTALPFAIRAVSSGEMIGSTRYGNIDRAHRRVEIGWTFLAPEWQRTRANTEAKYLLLRHAFEELGCIRVELKTDALNEASRRAILRIGAREEGIFRKHMITASGSIRDSVYFSITDDEWAGVKADLETKLLRR